MITFNEQDKAKFQEIGIEESQVKQQIENFKYGFPYIVLDRAAKVGDGIFSFSEKEQKELINYYDTEKDTFEIIKMVPASGAASRMFKSLLSYLNDTTSEVPKDVQTCMEQITSFAFYEELKDTLKKNNHDLSTLLENKDYKTILEYLMLEKGMNYANKPKALLLFHRYEDDVRTALEEHFVEGAQYIQAGDDEVKIHFTVSPEHLPAFKSMVKEISKKYEKAYQVNFYITYSVQKPSTDTIAVTLDNQIFRLSDNSILFRPGGHGALIHNLNDLEEEIVFIKNIDNVVPDHLKQDTYTYKKVLGGLLLRLKTQIDDYIDLLYEGSATEEELEEMRAFAEKHLLIHFDKETFALKDTEVKLDMLYETFNRPIRICGMVKNEGEPGGGPFWVKEESGKLSLQIVESAQIDMGNKQQAAIVGNATHFNPVDLVCCITNAYNEKFDLTDFINEKTGFISQKSKDGSTIKVQELPGLWNGAMADWITVFVEVPVSTFNPVKTINDLLRPQHQPK